MDAIVPENPANTVKMKMPCAIVIVLIMTEHACETTNLGYEWNSGIKLENGSYALKSTKGDDKQYVC